MKLHRFIGEFNISQENIEIFEKELINQIKNVLKLKKGEKIILSDGTGKNIQASIESIDKNKILCNILEEKEINDTSRKVNLYLAILKKENFELAVQKAVEVGVSKIIPIITDRTIKTGLNTIRLEKIIKEASEQSGRNFLPTLSPILNFKEALEDGKNSDEKILFHLQNPIYTPNNKSKKISIFIGPEGGFTEKEIEDAKNLNYKICSLGELTLRGETATIVATYRVVMSV